MDTQQDIATLEKIVAEKQELFERYDLLADQTYNSDPNRFGGVGLRSQTWNALEQAKLAKDALEKAQQDLERAKQRLQIPQQPTPQIIPLPQPIQPQQETPEEQVEDEPIDETQNAKDEDTQPSQDTEEADNTTGTNILKALTKKFTGNKIADKLLKNTGEKNEQ